MLQLGMPAPLPHSPASGCCNSTVATRHHAIYLSTPAPPLPQAVATVMLQLTTVPYSISARWHFHHTPDLMQLQQ